MPSWRRVVLGIAIALVCAGGVAVPARAAPDPGGDSVANVRLPPGGGKLLGVNGTFELAGTSYDEMLRRLARSGFNSVRRTLSWWFVEPARDQWSEPGWQATRAFYDAALAHGMRPVFNIGFSPPWARRLGRQLCVGVGFCELPPARAMDGEWAEFAAEAARRFPRAIFEIWNEPNTTEFWESGPDPERWAELVVVAHDAIKSVNRRIPIIVCGCAGNRPAASDAEGMEIGEFLARAYRHTPSIRGHHDGISLHFYPQGYQPFDPFSFGRGSHLADLLWRVRRVAARNGDRGVKLWVDEIGYWTADGPEASGRETASEAEAARGLTRLTRRLLTVPDVRAVMIHREVDGPGGDDRFAIRDASFGLMRRDPALARKPALCRFAAMAGRFAAHGCRRVRPPRTRIAEVRRIGPLSMLIAIETRSRRRERVECRLDRRAWRRCGRRVALRGLTPGPHRLMARAYRGDGTHDRTPATVRFRVGR